MIAYNIKQQTKLKLAYKVFSTLEQNCLLKRAKVEDHL